ncbi:MAG: bacterial Ig-like domain-containing protein, partial [Clostridia bacterium]|nr:bacterial Ig-like domain-containing protein [Clostridia bacterium]
ALPAKVTYLEGDAFDSTGMVVTASYTNGMVEPVVGYTVSGYDSTPGTKNIVVAYNGKTTEFTVEVASKTLTSIAITSMPAKLTYQEGERFDATGMVVTAYYNNNTNAMITDYTVSGYTSIPGTKTITVSYGGKTAKFNVVVMPSELTSIAVTTLPSKRTYLEGESFDPAGMVVTAYYNNNTNEAVTDYTISGYTSTPGTKRITITYGGKTAQFNVTVNAKELTSIAVTTKPTKTTYLEGESFNASGMVITAHYKNAASQAVTGYTVSGYDSTPGTKTITVAYQGKTADFQVTVRAKSVSSISITSEPTTKNYIQGESLDLAGMKVLVQYNNNTQETITQGWTVSGNTNTIGEQTVTVTYGGKSASFKIHVVAPFPFVDVPAELWYRSAVEYCYANGLMNGVTATTFDPDGTMTRAMVVTVLYRISGSPAVSGSAGFSDVSAEMWYAEEVAWAAQNGIANGVGDNRFAPEDIITREQFVTMLYRYAQKNGDDTSARKDLSGFADQAEVSSWGKDAVQWAVAEGIINGIAEGGKTYFKPTQSASRAQAAKMLMYYVENR